MGSQSRGGIDLGNGKPGRGDSGGSQRADDCGGGPIRMGSAYEGGCTGCQGGRCTGADGLDIRCMAEVEAAEAV